MKLKIYKGEFGYSIYCKNTKANIKCYIPVYFKDAKPEGEQVEIEVLDANFSCTTDKKTQLVKPTLWINDWRLVGVKAAPTTDDVAEAIIGADEPIITMGGKGFEYRENGKQLTITPDELPFY